MTKSYMPNFIDLEGQTFNRLTVIGYAGKSLWICRCECGNTITTRSNNLRNNLSKSCGCLRDEVASAFHTIHGHATRRNKLTPEYRAYINARSRCNNPNKQHFEYYGGRGIEFRFDSFEQFLAEVGSKPTPKHSLDRKDVNGHYETGNVRWATQTEQIRNRRK